MGFGSHRWISHVSGMNKAMTVFPVFTFVIIDNCQMNNIGLRQTFKKKKKILSNRLCFVCCFSVFVPRVCLHPKSLAGYQLSSHRKGGQGFEPPQAQSEAKLPNEMILCTGVYGELPLLVLVNPPRALLIFWKVCIRPWIFLVNMIKSARVRSHMPMWIKWTELATPNFYQWHRINNNYSIFF